MKLLCAVAVVAACQAESRLDRVAPASAPAVAKPPAGATDVESRLARLEHRLDKITEVLDRTLPPAEPDGSAVYSVPIDPRDPQQGPADAKVTIVEGYEFLCPYCYMVNPALDQILAKYPKDVRLVSKYLVVHGQAAIPPGIAACAAAKQGKFKELKAALWSHLFKMNGGDPEIQTDQIGPNNLPKIAQDAGLDTKKLATDMTNGDCSTWLQDNLSQFKTLGASATPTFFINGRYTAGAMSFEELDKMVADAIARADRSGVPAASYYDSEVVAKGAKRVKGRFED
jgi:protein-disulfide isomerase